MLKSMTGYGKSVCEVGNKKISIEIKTLNSKQTDINTKISGFFREKDIKIRGLLGKEFSRGKIDMNLNVEIIGENDNILLNEPVIKNYLKQLKSLKTELDIPESDLLQVLVRLPNVTKINVKEPKEEEWIIVNKTINEAIAKVQDFRLQEGNALEEDIVGRVKNIEKLLQRIEKPEKDRIEEKRLKIKQNLKEFCENERIDENRFEQEIIYYIEKFDINEEKVRLTNHCKYFNKTLKTEEAIGKKLLFISQEMGREINTISSKANNAEIQSIVVEMKDELEKMKEQLLNIL